MHVDVEISVTCLVILRNCIYIHLCGQREQNMKNSYSCLQRHSYIRTKCLSIFTRPTWTNYISPLSRRQTASSYDSSSYTHTIMFQLLPFYLLTQTYHICDEGVLLSDSVWHSITTFMLIKGHMKVVIIYHTPSDCSTPNTKYHVYVKR
jgi:hypothetical protein